MRIYVLILDKAQSLDIHTVHDYMYVFLVSNPFVLDLELPDHPFWVHELSSTPSSATTPAARKYIYTYCVTFVNIQNLTDI